MPRPYATGATGYGGLIHLDVKKTATIANNARRNAHGRDARPFTPPGVGSRSIGTTPDDRTRLNPSEICDTSPDSWTGRRVPGVQVSMVWGILTGNGHVCRALTVPWGASFRGYERSVPGGLVHLDINNVARIPPSRGFKRRSAPI